MDFWDNWRNYLKSSTKALPFWKFSVLKNIIKKTKDQKIFCWFYLGVYLSKNFFKRLIKDFKRFRIQWRNGLEGGKSKGEKG